MRSLHQALIAATIALYTLSASSQAGKATIDDRKLASDGITSGWLIEYPWPDPLETSQSWRTIPATLVIARHGHVLRRIPGDSTFWSWSFWHGGSQVAYQTGPMHGASHCILTDVSTGRVQKRWPGDCSNATAEAPAWVKAATATYESK